MIQNPTKCPVPIKGYFVGMMNKCFFKKELTKPRVDPNVAPRIQSGREKIPI